MEMTLSKLADLVSEETGVDIRTQSRKSKYVVARAIYYDIAYNHELLGTLNQIGKEVGRDHASVLYSLRTIVPQMERYFKYAHAISLKIKERLELIAKDPYNDVIDIVKNVPEDKLDELIEIITNIIDSHEGNDIQEHQGDLHALS